MKKKNTIKFSTFRCEICGDADRTNLSEIQSQKMQLEDDVALLRHKLEEERRWRKFPEKDRRTLTNEDYELAKRILPTLPEGWYRERHEWDAAKW